MNEMDVAIQPLRISDMEKEGGTLGLPLHVDIRHGFQWPTDRPPLTHPFVPTAVCRGTPRHAANRSEKTVHRALEWPSSPTRD